MKTEFSNFQLPKVAMNKIRGGVDAGHVEDCHCAGGKTFQVIVNSSVNLETVMAKNCDGGDWACSRQQ